MSKYQLRNFSLFLMRKQPVSVSVSRGFFGHERGFAKIGMQRPLLWHIQLKLRSFFCWAQAKSTLACAAFWSQQQTNGRNGTMKWFFYKFLKKLNATRRLPKNTAKVMLADWIELAEAVWLKAGGCVVGGGLGSWSQHSDWVPFVLPGQQYWPRPRSRHPKWEMHGNLANSV